MQKKNVYILAVAVLAVGTGFWIYSAQSQPATPGGDQPIEVDMSSTAGCECCVDWADHLEENGFEVNTRIVANLGDIKQALGVPRNMASCHTAQVEGYVIEGHVPAEDVKRLLEERPDGIGLAVPGMPIGSPGMEMEDRPDDEYRVYLLDEGGNHTIFAEHE